MDKIYIFASLNTFITLNIMNKTNQIFFLSASLLFMGCSAVNGKGKEAGGAEPDSPVFVAGSYSAQNEEGIKIFTFAQDDAGWAYKSGISGISNPSFLSGPAAGNIIYSVAEGGDGDSYIYALKYSPDSMTPAMAGHDRTLGSAPCFVMADAKSGVAFTANYSGGSLTVFGADGGGPGHMCFHPDGKRAYVITELSGDVVVMDTEGGRTAEIIQTAKADTVGGEGSADIHLSPYGKASAQFRHNPEREVYPCGVSR